MVCSNSDEHVGVQIFQLRQGGLCARYFAYMLGATVEIATDVLNGHEGGVVDGDLLGSCQDEVFSDLDAELNMSCVTPVTP